MSGNGGDETPIERIVLTNEQTLLTAFRRNPQGLTLDDLVSITGLEKNSISGPRLNLERQGLILKIGERRWNAKRNRKQHVYCINFGNPPPPPPPALAVIRGGWHL